jgi:hypothetical protein
VTIFACGRSGGVDLFAGPAKHDTLSRAMDKIVMNIIIFFICFPLLLMIWNHKVEMQRVEKEEMKIL